MAKSSQRRYDMPIIVKLDDLLYEQRISLNFLLTCC